MKSKLVKRIGTGLGMLILIAFGAMLLGGISPIGLGLHDEVMNENGIAFNGYDPVEYFVSGVPTKGSAELSLKNNDITWFFSSEENKLKFEANPSYFIPKYGGHCSFAASTGFAVEGDPEFFIIKENKLYILSNPEVKEEFEKGGDEIIKTCDENWK